MHTRNRHRSRAYGDPLHCAIQRNAPHTILSFLSATKQSPSFFFLVTPGPVMLLLLFTEKAGSWFAEFCRVHAGNRSFLNSF